MSGRWGRVARPLAGAALCLSSSLAAGVEGATAEVPSSGYDGRFSTAELQAAMPVIAPVPGVRTSWVARDATRNGLPMQIQQLESTRPLRDVADAYRQRFTDIGMLAPHEDAGPDFAQLYGGLGPYFVRLNLVRRQGHTTGYLSVIAQPGTVQPQRSSEFPVPAAVEIVSRMAYGDDGDEAETLMGHSRDLPGVLTDDFMTAMTAEGWSRAGSADSERNTSSMRGRANLTYRRGDEIAQIVIVGRDNEFPRRSVVMVHWLKSP